MAQTKGIFNWTTASASLRILTFRQQKVTKENQPIYVNDLVEANWFVKYQLFQIQNIVCIVTDFDPKFCGL